MKKFFFVFSTLILSFSTAVLAEPFLADSHKTKGVACESCHGENNAVSEEKCIACHGDMDKMGDKSQGKFAVNPHAPHGAHVSCVQCHKGHKEGVNYCNKCHDFDFKVK